MTKNTTATYDPNNVSITFGDGRTIRFSEHDPVPINPHWVVTDKNVTETTIKVNMWQTLPNGEVSSSFTFSIKNDSEQLKQILDADPYAAQMFSLKFKEPENDI